MSKSKSKAEYGDFQTPAVLASAVCSLLTKQGVRPISMVEPTCGLGSFVCAALDHFKELKSIVAADVNAEYIAATHKGISQRKDGERTRVVEADFFRTDWSAVLRGLAEPVLILGNLPWVTNAHLATLGSQNLPTKSNFQNRAGLDAITGKANFDISEWMLMQLFSALNGRNGWLAMLCKASVVRKILQHAWRTGLPIVDSGIYAIDCASHFGASVDAALLVTRFSSESERCTTARTYPDLSDARPPGVIGFEDGFLLADADSYRRLKHLKAAGDSDLRWRSGVKHDCSQVMELYRHGNHYRNGLDQVVDLEDTYVFPMVKSSGVAKAGKSVAPRYMIVTQAAVGDDTRPIQRTAPKTWAYLMSNAERLDTRGSSIYRGRPPFSVFGVGEYTFALWKVAISGFYKSLTFTILSPISGKPVILDDTSYFLACRTEEQAQYLASLLNSEIAQSFYRSFIFWDNKRPITADLLGRLDLRALAREVGSEAIFSRLLGRPMSESTGFWEIWDRDAPESSTASTSA